MVFKCYCDSEWGIHSRLLLFSNPGDEVFITSRTALEETTKHVEVLGNFCMLICSSNDPYRGRLKVRGDNASEDDAEMVKAPTSLTIPVCNKSREMIQALQCD